MFIVNRNRICLTALFITYHVISPPHSLRELKYSHGKSSRNLIIKTFELLEELQKVDS
jgi:hypothetical protein